MIRPTRNAVLLLAALLALAVAPAVWGEELWRLWLGGVGALLLALGLDFALAPGRSDLDVDVEVPTAIHIGDSAPLTLRLAARRSVAVEARLELHGDVAPLPPVRLRCTAGHVTELVQRLEPVRRGRFRVERAWLRWTGPLRLLWRERRVAVGKPVEVLVNVRAVRDQALRWYSSREFQVGLRVEKYIGDGSEFDALREFVPGMDRRAVDWKASARHRRLLSREYRAERNHQVVLAIDTGHLMAEPLDGLPRLDHAIHAALQLGYVCLRTGDLVGLCAFAAEPQAWVRPESGVHALAAIQQSMAKLDYGEAETNYTLALTDLLQRTRRRSLVVLFTEFVDSVTAELMLPNIERLARRHLLLFVALRDPLLPRLAAAAPTRLFDVHRAVVSGGIMRERELVLERIRRAGAQVIDAEAKDVGSKLIERYLLVKRRELV